MPLVHVNGCKAKCNGDASCFLEKVRACQRRQVSAGPQKSFTIDDDADTLVFRDGEDYVALGIDDVRIILASAAQVPRFREVLRRFVRG